MKKQRLTSKTDWEKAQSRQESGSHVKLDIYHPVFHPIIKRFLKPVKGKSCLELGCVPGRFLIYFNKAYGYYPEGVDYSDQISQTDVNLRKYGLSNFQLFQEDVFKFNPKKQYDLVCSFGLIEHFADPNPILEKHWQLLKPNGWLIVSVPKFTGLQAKLLGWDNSKALANHNDKLMDPRVLRKVVEKLGAQTLYCNYAGTFGFMSSGDKIEMSKMKRGVITLITKGSRKLQTLFSLIDLEIPNRLFSPSVICLARKPKK